MWYKFETESWEIIFKNLSFQNRNKKRLRHAQDKRLSSRFIWLLSHTSGGALWWCVGGVYATIHQIKLLTSSTTSKSIERPNLKNYQKWAWRQTHLDTDKINRSFCIASGACQKKRKEFSFRLPTLVPHWRLYFHPRTGDWREDWRPKLKWNQTSVKIPNQNI